MKPEQVAWVAIGGSIFTKVTVKIDTPSGKRHVPHSIAFNVGQDRAEHIVHLHNASLDKHRREKLWDRFIQHLNEVQPLGKKEENVQHKTFLGSIESYKKIFLSTPNET